MIFDALFFPCLPEPMDAFLNQLPPCPETNDLDLPYLFPYPTRKWNIVWSPTVQGNSQYPWHQLPGAVCPNVNSFPKMVFVRKILSSLLVLVASKSFGKCCNFKQFEYIYIYVCMYVCIYVCICTCRCCYVW